MKFFHNLLRDEAGATAIEYGLIGPGQPALDDLQQGHHRDAGRRFVSDELTNQDSEGRQGNLPPLSCV